MYKECPCTEITTMKKLFIFFILTLAVFLSYFYSSQNKSDKSSYKYPHFNASINQKDKKITTIIESNGTKLAFSLPQADAKMKKSKNTTTFDTPDTAYQYEVKKDGLAQGLKETIILKNKSAPNEYSFSLNPENISFVKQNPEKKTWHFFNKQNKEVFYIPKGFMVDASGIRSNSVNIDVTKSGERYTLRITADKAWITDPNRYFPIKVDPSILVPEPKLYLSVTKVGRFRWKMAIEYEIRDEKGKVLGSDVVITEIRPEETNTDISLFLKDYFTRRLATWSLAQGDFILREMSYDRLTSSHFQTADNGDEVDDKYKELRQARKQLIDSFNKTPYPDISLTPMEAYLIQKPEDAEGDEYGDTSEKRTKSRPTFDVKNEKIGAGTEILRPNGVGDATGICCQVGAGATHWDKLDEVVADDVTTYVYHNDFSNATDYYALADTVLTSETVDSIDVTARGGTNGSYMAGTRLNAADTNGAARTQSAFTTHTDSAIARPGGGSWAVGDLNSLQASFKCLPASVQCCNGSGNCWTCASDEYVTQIYITVNYSAGGATNTPAPTPTPAPNVKIQGGINIQGGAKLKSN